MSLAVTNVCLEPLLTLIAQVCDYQIISETNVFSMGDPELIGFHPRLIRRAYMLPQKLIGSVQNSMPPQLAGSGPAVGYDVNTRMLNFIGKPDDMNVFEVFLNSMGAVRMDQNSCERDDLL